MYLQHIRNVGAKYRMCFALKIFDNDRNDLDINLTFMCGLFVCVVGLLGVI